MSPRNPAYVGPPSLSPRELKALSVAVEAAAEPVTNLLLFIIVGTWKS